MLYQFIVNIGLLNIEIQSDIEIFLQLSIEIVLSLGAYVASFKVLVYYDVCLALSLCINSPQVCNEQNVFIKKPDSMVQTTISFKERNGCLY